MNIKVYELNENVKIIKNNQYNTNLMLLNLSQNLKISDGISYDGYNIKNLINEKFFSIYNIFKSLSLVFKEINSDLLFHKMSRFLGKNLVEKSDQDDWLSLKKIIIKKKNDNNNVSIYYEGLLELFYGLDHLKNNQEIDYDIFSEQFYLIKQILEEIILFIEIFEHNNNIKDIEIKYQAAILYLINKFLNKEQFNNVIMKNNDHRKMIKILISICNLNNYIFYYQK